MFLLQVMKSLPRPAIYHETRRWACTRDEALYLLFKRAVFLSSKKACNFLHGTVP